MLDAFQVTEALKTMVRMTSDMETYILAVERINEYTELEEEVRPSYVSLFFLCSIEADTDSIN